MVSRRQFFLRSLAAGAGIATRPAHLLAANERAEPNCNATGCYTRMFPRLARPSLPPDSPLLQGLKDLGSNMVDDEPGNEGIFNAVPAGYTYLGQFIDHDLTLDLTPLGEAQPNAKQTPNFRTPFLDLDQVYGGGPNISPFLYDRESKRGEERFLIAQTTEAEGRKPSEDDLPRNSQGIALVGDPRQDENLILAQLHVAFLKFHNAVLKQPDILKSSPYREAGPPFEAARRIVTWHYQWIVRNDFLNQFIDANVFADLRHQWAGNAGSGCFRIPIEFSAAVFRFGHSMVRDSYDYNEDKAHENVPLQQLLKLTGSGDPNRPDAFSLPANWVIYWPRFFLGLGRSPHTNRIRKIDTKIAKALHDLQLETVKQFNAAMAKEPRQLTSPENKLPVRTLVRGAQMGLPSGQEVADALGVQPLDPEKQIATGSDADILRNHGFHKDTPLWYYILKEAEIPPRKGRYLGPVGSRIVADVIVAALKADPNSYLSVAPNWKPTLAGEAGKRSFGMPDLLRFVFPALIIS